MLEYRDWFYYTSTLILIVSIGFYLFNWKELPRYFRWLIGFLSMHLFLDFVAQNLAKANIPNLPLLHIYTLLEFVFLALFYKSLLEIPSFLRRNFPLLIAFGALLIVGNTIFLQKPYEFNSYAKTGSNISIILFALLYYYNALLGRIPTTFQTSLNFINLGLFIFYMGTLLVFLFSDFLRRNDQHVLLEMWNINLVLSLLLQGLILTGLILARPSRVVN